MAFYWGYQMKDLTEMTEGEIRERKKSLAYQAFFLQTERTVADLKSSLNDLEKHDSKKEKE